MKKYNYNKFMYFYFVNMNKKTTLIIYSIKSDFK